MLDYRVAHRYAKSLIELAESKGILDKVHEDISLFATACEESRELSLLLKTPIVKHVTKKKILRKLFDGKVDKMTSAFFDIICDKNRESFLQDIAKEFHIQYNIHKGIVAAQVTTAVELNDELRKEFNSILKDISGKKNIELEEIVDEELIGGYILKVGDRQIDDSVSGKLNALRRKLIISN